MEKIISYAKNMFWNDIYTENNIETSTNLFVKKVQYPIKIYNTMGSIL